MSRATRRGSGTLPSMVKTSTTRAASLRASPKGRTYTVKPVESVTGSLSPRVRYRESRSSSPGKCRMIASSSPLDGS